MDNSKCVVLVPVAHHIEPECDRALRELEKRGYHVWRVWGHAAIDQGRSQMATDALAQGFEELMWIDADTGFDPAAVDKLRSHQLPVVCGICTKKSVRAVAAYVLPTTEKIIFGSEGGLMELFYSGTGFLLTRRSVYETIAKTQNLPICNVWEGQGTAIIPYFLPMIVPWRGGSWYLGRTSPFASGCAVRTFRSWPTPRSVCDTMACMVFRGRTRGRTSSASKTSTSTSPADDARSIHRLSALR